MAYSDVAPTDIATPWFADRLNEQRGAHDGSTLRGLAETVLTRLPAGAVTLVSSSVEGCALAAAVAVIRDEKTRWEHLAVGRPHATQAGSVVVVEPLLLGQGMLETLDTALPGALILHGLSEVAPALAPAA
jgi:hypothetical protein